MNIKMKVSGLSLDKAQGTPVLILQEEFKDRSLVIPLSILEASSISAELEKLNFMRPLPHDLILQLLGTFESKIESVKIVDFTEDTFYAELIFITNGKRTTMDMRPSDAVILALKTHSPIYADPEIFIKTASLFSFPDLDKKDLSEENWASALDKKGPHRLQ